MNKKKISKKGATHVDWVMSMGIFLIYLLSLFTIIKPGVKDIHDGDTLLFILEDNLNKNVIWIIKETPLFMKGNCIKHEEIPPQIKLNLIGTDWKFSKIDPIPEEDYTLNDYGFLLWDDSLINQKDYFLTYYPTAQEPSRSSLELQSSPNPPYCDVELGVTEETKGLSEEWLTNLQSQNYEELKTAWGYPESKDFAIYIDGMEEPFSFNPVEPSQQANVFVKEWKSYLINNNGDTTPIKINIRVW